MLHMRMQYGNRPNGGWFASLLRPVVGLVALVLGLIFVASVLVALIFLALVWSLRAAWARLTGRPVSPWVVRVHPRDAWRRFNPPRDAQQPGARRGVGDVTDVEPKQPHGQG